MLGRATTRLIYDLFAYLRAPDSARIPSLPRSTRWRARPTTPTALVKRTKVQHSFSYSDGFGREMQKKVQAESGPVPVAQCQRRIMVGTDGQPEMTANSVSPRWVGSGWTVFNNKGKPVRQYEPFFTDTHRFEFDVRSGSAPCSSTIRSSAWSRRFTPIILGRR